MAEKKKSYRTAISLPWELYEWISDLADSMGIPVATCCTVLLNETKRNRENQLQMMELFRSMSKKDYEALKREFEDSADKLDEELKLPFRRDI